MNHSKIYISNVKGGEGEGEGPLFEHQRDGNDVRKEHLSQNLTPEMMRCVSLTRLISGVSSTKAALPWTCLRKLSEYSTWGAEGVREGW